MFPARYAHLFHSSLDHGDPRWKAHPPLLPLWSSLALSTLTILLTAPFLSSSPEINIPILIGTLLLFISTILNLTLYFCLHLHPIYAAFSAAGWSLLWLTSAVFSTIDAAVGISLLTSASDDSGWVHIEDEEPVLVMGGNGSDFWVQAVMPVLLAVAALGIVGVYARLFVLAVRVRRVQRAARNAVRKLEELKETV